MLAAHLFDRLLAPLGFFKNAYDLFFSKPTLLHLLSHSLEKMEYVFLWFNFTGSGQTSAGVRPNWLGMPDVNWLQTNTLANGAVPTYCYDSLERTKTITDRRAPSTSMNFYDNVSLNAKGRI
jgi:YD repeat-containing protein